MILVSSKYLEKRVCFVSTHLLPPFPMPWRYLWAVIQWIGIQKLFLKKKCLFLPLICFHRFHLSRWYMAEPSPTLHRRVSVNEMWFDIQMVRLIQRSGRVLRYVILITHYACKLTLKRHWDWKTRLIVARWYIQTHFLERWCEYHFQ